MGSGPALRARQLTPASVGPSPGAANSLPAGTGCVRSDSDGNGRIDITNPAEFFGEADECIAMTVAIGAQNDWQARAIDGLGLGEPDKVLVDGHWDFVGRGTTQRIIKGDATCLSIAAASILAKVTRDRLMREEGPHFPGYDFELNKGYPCPRHKAALRGYGPSAINRRSWVFMDNLPWTGIPRVFPAGMQQVLFDDCSPVARKRVT